MSIFLNILILLFVLFVVITIHELGHYWAALLSKIRIKEFSIGFGPKIFRKTSKRSKINYFLKIILLGGYVLVDSYQLRRFKVLETNLNAYYETLDHKKLSASEKRVEKEIKMNCRNATKETLYKLEPFEQKNVKLLEDSSLLAKVFFILAGITMNFLAAILISLAYNLTQGEQIKIFATIGSSFESFFRSVEIIFNPFLKITGNHAEGLPSIVRDGTPDLNFLILLLISFNISLLVLNILPMPPLDGYRFCAIIYESISKKPIPETFQIVTTFIGFAILIWMTIAFTINGFIN